MMKRLNLTFFVASLLVSLGLEVSAQFTFTVDQPAYSSDRLIVKLKPESYEYDPTSLFNQHGLSLDKRFPKGRLDILTFQNSKRSLAETKQALEESGRYEWVAYDYEISLDTTDTHWDRMWHLKNTGQYIGGHIGADIDAERAWEECTGGGDHVIVVFDDGVDYTHPDLQANMWRNPGEIPGNGEDDDNNGYIDDVYGIDTGLDDSDPMAFDDHGTHVAGIIGARGNNKNGISGVVWETKIMAIQSADFNDEGDVVLFNSDIIEGLEYVLFMKESKGIPIVAINCSWGGGSSGFGEGEPLDDLFDRLTEAGILIVCSAGNGGSDSIGDNNDTIARFPSNHDSDRVIAVANSNIADSLRNDSNYGYNSVDVAAPGGGIYSTLPNNGYGWKYGTSMAAPVVTGIISMLYSADPGLSPEDVRHAIVEGVDWKESLSTKVNSKGRVNAYNSLQLIKKPYLTHYTHGAQLERSDALFAWDRRENDVDYWYLKVGSGPLRSDYYESGVLNSDIEGNWVDGLPTDGSTVYATLYWWLRGQWRYRVYEYTAQNLNPTVTAPANGDVLQGSRVRFTWEDQGHDVEEWSLSVGFEPFVSDIYWADGINGDSTGVWVENIPQTGRTVYARLGWRINGQWTWESYEYLAKLD
jgi:subtilisin family serine protease